MSEIAEVMRHNFALGKWVNDSGQDCPSIIDLLCRSKRWPPMYQTWTHMKVVLLDAVFGFFYRSWPGFYALQVASGAASKSVKRFDTPSSCFELKHDPHVSATWMWLTFTAYLRYCCELVGVVVLCIVSHSLLGFRIIWCRLSVRVENELASEAFLHGLMCDYRSGAQIFHSKLSRFHFCRILGSSVFAGSSQTTSSFLFVGKKTNSVSFVSNMNSKTCATHHFLPVQLMLMGH